MAITSSARLSTLAIHAGYDSQEYEGAINPPLHLSSTFAFKNTRQGADIFAGNVEGHVYSRISNPTLTMLETRIAALESAEAGLATASGMAAITAVFWSLLSQGDEVVVDKTLYGCTHAFLTQGLSKFGVLVKHVDMTNIDDVAAAISAHTKIIFFETPANPNMRLIDIATVSELAKQHNILTIVDNTYATPVITRPIELGADVVVHSATKYLGGHGDLIGGLIVSSSELIERFRLEGVKDMTGACMSPFTAMLILRGMKTLELRMQKHSENAMHIVEWLSSQPQVKRLFYPFNSASKQFDLAKRQMQLGGGMIAFELDGGISHGVKLMDALNLIQRAVSLGDAESLIQHPVSMTHSTYGKEELKQHGISDSLIRLSVGLEDKRDIQADMAQAFTYLSNK